MLNENAKILTGWVDNFFKLENFLLKYYFSLHHIMEVNLYDIEWAQLKAIHHKADARQRDRIMAILMLDRGYTFQETAEVLLIDDMTIRRWWFYTRPKRWVISLPIIIMGVMEN